MGNNVNVDENEKSVTQRNESCTNNKSAPSTEITDTKKKRNGSLSAIIVGNDESVLILLGIRNGDNGYWITQLSFVISWLGKFETPGTEKGTAIEEALNERAHHLSSESWNQEGEQAIYLSAKDQRVTRTVPIEKGRKIIDYLSKHTGMEYRGGRWKGWSWCCDEKIFPNYVGEEAQHG